MRQLPEVGEVVGQVLRKNGEEVKVGETCEGGSAREGDVGAGNGHGLVSLVMIQRLPGGQEVERLVEQAVRVHLASWRLRCAA